MKYDQYSMFEDRENDWLAQEMRREGYVNNRSSLEKDHQKEERSRDWNAGAISNAEEHHDRHQRTDAFRKGVVQQVNRGNKTANFIGVIFILIWLIVFITIMLQIWRF